MAPFRWEKPTNRPFQERTVGVKDTFGDVWYVATYAGGVAR
jgi:hypothetical protein